MLQTCRVELAEANAYVESLHRHHKPVRGHRFSVGCKRNGELCGVAIVGRPVSRNVDQKNVAEVLRVCTDGTGNACSFLLAKCARIAKEMGFEIIQTYTLEDEPGTSLVAAGWINDSKTSGGKWARWSRPNRRTGQPDGAKKRWRKTLNEQEPTQ